MAQGLMDDWVAELMYVQQGNWISAAAATLFFYDCFLMLDRELEYIWCARWSISKVLFLMHRCPMMVLTLFGLYATVRSSAVSPSPKACRVYDDVLTYASIILFAVIQMTLIIRIYALYRKSWKVLAFLTFLFCASNIAILVLYHKVRVFIIYAFNPVAPYFNFCYRFCPECMRWSTYMYIPMLVLDTTILLMTVYQSYVAASERAAAPTLTILYRDGIIYFIVIFGVVLTNILFLSLAPSAMQPWFLPFMRPLISSMATRLTLNLHGQLHMSSTGAPFNLESDWALGLQSIIVSNIQSPDHPTYSRTGGVDSPKGDARVCNDVRGDEEIELKDWQRSPQGLPETELTSRTRHRQDGSSDIVVGETGEPRIVE
ncbi:hypothetical protein FRB99_008397, partial [Tulasnella sp. 403]